MYMYIHLFISVQAFTRISVQQLFYILLKDCKCSE